MWNFKIIFFAKKNFFSPKIFFWTQNDFLLVCFGKFFFGAKIFSVPKMAFCWYVLKNYFLVQKIFSGPKMTFCYNVLKKYFLVQNFFWTQNDFLLICFEKIFFGAKFFLDPKWLFVNNKNLILPPGFSNFFTVLHATFCILVDEFQDS